MKDVLAFEDFLLYLRLRSEDFIHFLHTCKAFPGRIDGENWVVIAALRK